MKIGIIGLGVVGSSILSSFKIKNINVFCYDKYKLTDNFESILNCSIVFLCLPTLFNDVTMEYDKDAIHENCVKLVENNYNGIVVLKSTVEPGTTDNLANKYNLKFVFNPEFLTSSTAFEDFHNQSHIVLGRTKKITDDDLDIIKSFYNDSYPDAEISITSAINGESMKIFCNSFYAVKIQYFNELFLLCEKNSLKYNILMNYFYYVKRIMVTIL